MTIRYEHNEEAVLAAQSILEQTVLRKSGSRTMIIIGVLVAAGVVAGFAEKNYGLVTAMLFIAVVCGAAFLMRGRGEKTAARNQVNDSQEYWSPDRTLEVCEEEVIVRAQYDNPYEKLTDKQLADSEFMSLREEMRREAGELHYRYNKCTCYESADAFLIYCTTSIHQSILKSQLTADEVEYLRTQLSEKFGKRYVPLTAQ